MKFISYFIITILIFSCKEATTSEVILKNPTVIPSELKFESRTLATVLNEELFNYYELNPREKAEGKYNLQPEDFVYETEFVSYLKKKQSIKPRTFGAGTLLSIRLSFECEYCKTAYFFKAAGNEKNIRTQILLALKDPKSSELEVPSEDGVFAYNSEKTTLELNGFVGFYLALIDYDGGLFIYEIAGVTGDSTSPVFRIAEACEDTIPGNPNDGLVCFDVMYFEGNEADGYSVPLKGQVYGDVAYIAIDGKSVAFEQGEFFTRVSMNLFTGYNQVPVVLADRFENRTESFIEIELEAVKPPAKE